MAGATQITNNCLKTLGKSLMGMPAAPCHTSSCHTNVLQMLALSSAIVYIAARCFQRQGSDAQRHFDDGLQPYRTKNKGFRTYPDSNSHRRQDSRARRWWSSSTEWSEGTAAASASSASDLSMWSGRDSCYSKSETEEEASWEGGCSLHRGREERVWRKRRGPRLHWN